MKRLTFMSLLVLFSIQHLAAQVEGDNLNFVLESTSNAFNDFWLTTNGGIRGLVTGTDLDQDGLYEIITSDYDDGGKVHVFEIQGDNTMHWVWSSPGLSEGNPTTCRFAGVSDLDGNGRMEILLSISEPTGNSSDSAGIHIYEWTGQNNDFGLSPVAVTRGLVPIARFRCDSFVAEDVDNDGKQELVLAINGEGAQDYFVILSLTGEFSQGNFSWTKEQQFTKDTHFEGDAINVLTSDMDNDGIREIIAHSAHYLMLFPIESDGPDSYTWGSTIELDNSIFNDLNLINGVAVDLDQDGKDEVLYNGWKTGNLYLLRPDGNATDLNDSHVFLLSNGKAGARFVSHGMACGDQDHAYGSDGPDIYVGAAGYTSDLFNMEFLGGDVTDSLNYQWYTVYDDPSDGSAILSAVSAPIVDLDKDGRREIVLGYQSIPDSVDGLPIDKQWLRILEYDIATSVEGGGNWSVHVPTDMFLVSNNHPNPFYDQTVFTLTMHVDGFVRGDVFNLLGQRVATIFAGEWRQSGSYSVSWTGLNDSGGALANGVYFARFNLNGYSVLKRITLAR